MGGDEINFYINLFSCYHTWLHRLKGGGVFELNFYISGRRRHVLCCCVKHMYGGGGGGGEEEEEEEGEED